MCKIATWRETDARQIELTNCVVDFITSSLQPLSKVDDPAFRSMIHKAQPAFTMPSRKYLSTKLLPEKTAQLHSRIQHIVANFGIEHKIGTVITDNAANMLKAFVQLPGTPLTFTTEDSDSDDGQDDESAQQIRLIWIICHHIYHVSYTHFI